MQGRGGNEAHTLAPAPSGHPLSTALSHLTFYAIDSEDTHRTYRDPDDAVAMETLPDGTTMLHVAVVDSTAIPLGSLSDKQAARRGESNYMPSYIPMLESHWYEDIGLWDGERNALVTSVHLSRKGNIIGTSLSRSRVTVQSLVHQEAAKRMEDPTHPLGVMADRMQQLRHHREQVTQRIHSDSLTGLDVGLEGTVGSWKPSQPGLHKVHRMIQETMILGNTAIAEWANANGLPLIYRNHGPDVPDYEIGRLPIRFDVHQLRADDEATRSATRQKINDFISIRAQYQATCHGHEGVGSKAYAHTTSPLRRYVDIVNQKMMSYALGMLSTVESTLAVTEENRQNLHEHLWQEGGKLTRPIYEYHAAAPPDKEALRPATIALIKDVTEHCATAAGIAAPDSSALTTMAEGLLDSPPVALPYRISDLQQISEHLNHVLHVPQEEKKRLSKERIDSWLRRVMQHPDPDILAAAGSEEFTTLIKRAAITGQINGALFNEIRARIEEHKGIRPIVTYASILAYAPDDSETAYEEQDHTQKGYWRQLKKLVLDELKFDAGSVDDVLDNIQEMFEGKFSIVMENQNLLDIASHPLHASLCVAKLKDEVLASPSYVTMPEGHAALARAMSRYQFLESLANHALVPIQDVPLPDTMAASIRRVMYPVDLLLDIAQKNDIHYHITQSEWNGNRRTEPRLGDTEVERGFSASITLSGDTIARLIAGTPERGEKYRAAGALWCRKNSLLSMEDALARAARNLLGKPEVEQLMPKDIIVDYTIPEDPIKVLHEAEKDHQLTIRFTSEKQNGTTHQRIYNVSLLVHGPKPDEAVLFSEQITSPDEPHARFELARKAVEHLREHRFIDNFRQDGISPHQLSLFATPDTITRDHEPSPRIPPATN